MLEKDSKTTDKYSFNGRTTFQVRNTRIEDDRGNTCYRVEVTLKHKPIFSEKPLVFGSAEEIGDFVDTIDFSDPQLSLPLDGDKK